MSDFASRPSIHGQCDPRFEAVKTEFTRLHQAGEELGSSLALYVGGELVVDLWAGERDREGAPWQQDTLTNVFSVSKAVTAVCMLRAAELGAIELDRPVADYWPEYGRNGKKRTLVSWLLNHRAGQPAFKTRLREEELYDWERITSLLAEEEPWWEPGRQHGYHMVSYGWLVGEVMRRALGITVSQFLQEEIAGPLGLDMGFGVNPADDHRVATLTGAKKQPVAGRLSLFNHVLTQPGSLTAKAMTNPLSIMNGANREAWRRAEIPSANLFTTARALATLFGKLACREGVLGEDALQHCMREESAGDDPVLLTRTRFGPGFMLQQPGHPEAEFGPGQQAFGHPGAGGALVFADPERGLGFGYVMNLTGPYVLLDPRPRRLIDAAYQCLG